jgi:hypothetical protein
LSAVRGLQESAPPDLDRILNRRRTGLEGPCAFPSALKRSIRSAELESVPPAHGFGRFEQDRCA